MRPLIPIASFWLCLCISNEVDAQPQPTVTLSYLRDASAASCPDEEAMRRGVSARLGRQPFHPQAERSLRVHLKATSAGYAVDIVVHDAEGAVVGKRSLRTDHNDCAELASAMQLAIAIAIDPLHDLPGPPAPQAETPPAPDTATPPAPAPAMTATPRVEAPAAPAPPAPAPERASRHLGVGLSLAATTEPNPSAGLTLQYSHRGDHAAWAVEGRLDKPSEVSAKSGQVETSLASASLLLCLRSALDVCALASIGNLWGRGSGYSESLSFQTPYAAGGLRLAHHLAVHRNLDIQISGDLLGRLNRTTLLVDDEEVWTSSLFEIALGARAVWRVE